MSQTAEIELHEEFIQAAFDSVLLAESELAEIEGRLSKAVSLIKTEKALAEQKLSKAWGEVKALMDSTGEVELMFLAQGGSWNKVYYTTPRESVKVDDPDVVPDEFVKLERKPMLKEIGEYLRAGNKPNWAAFQTGEIKLAWKNVKRKDEANVT